MSPRKVCVVFADDVGRELWDAAPIPLLKNLEAKGRRYLNGWEGPVCSNFRALFHCARPSHDPKNLVGGNFPAGDPNFSLPTDTGQLIGQVSPGSRAYHGKYHVCNELRYLHPLEAGFQLFTGSMTNLSNYFLWEKVVNGVPTTSSKYAGYDVRDDAVLSLQAGFDLVVASFHLPHNPYHEPPAELHSQSAPWDNYKYAIAMMEALDKLASSVIEMALSLGYIVVFVADNGTAPQIGGKKGTLWELGINCPLFWIGSGVPAGTASEVLVSATDFHSTIMELRGAAPLQLDSVSYAQDVLGQPFTGRAYLKCSKWLATGEPPQYPTWDRAVRSKRWKLISLGAINGPIEKLFDLQNDRGEQTDLLLPENLPLSAQAQVAYNRLKSELPTI